MNENCLCVLVVTKTAKVSVSVSGVGLGLRLHGLDNISGAVTVTFAYACSCINPCNQS